MFTITPDHWIKQLWDSLEECGGSASTDLVVKLLSDLLPPEEIDRLYKTGDLQDIHKLLYALVNFLRDKKKEAKTRGVKTFYGN